MRCTAIGRTVSFCLFSLLFLLVLASGPARADEWTEFRTGICCTDEGYAEFRFSGSFDYTDADKPDVVYEFPGQWPWDGFENSWRCDLADGETLTVRYRIFTPWGMRPGGKIRLSAWVNGAKTYSGTLWTDNSMYSTHKVFERVRLDRDGLKICFGEDGCEEVARADLPTVKDPGFRAGRAHGDPLPILHVTGPRVFQGDGLALCKTVLWKYYSNEMSWDFDWNMDTWKAPAICKGHFSEALRVDVDNDGERETVFLDEISEYNSAGSRLVVFDSSDIPEDMCEAVDRLRWPSDFDKWTGKGSQPHVVNDLPGLGKWFHSKMFHFDDKVYVLARGLGTQREFFDKRQEEITGAVVYEQLPDGDIDVKCRFSAPYYYYENVPTKSPTGKGSE